MLRALVGGRATPTREPWPARDKSAGGFFLGTGARRDKCAVVLTLFVGSGDPLGTSTCARAGVAHVKRIRVNAKAARDAYPELASVCQPIFRTTEQSTSEARRNETREILE
jgi:hypothetical protein